MANPPTSPLPPQILAALDGDTATLAELSAHLNITDARLQWHLRRMLDAGQVGVRDEHWALTPDGARLRRGDQAGTKYGLHWVLTPVDLHPLADS